MRTIIFLLIALFSLLPFSALASDDVYKIPDDAALIRSEDEARLITLGFLVESGTEDDYTQAVRAFQRYLARLAQEVTPESLPSSTLEILPDVQDANAAKALSIKPLATYSEIEDIDALWEYAIVDNEGQLEDERSEEMPKALEEEESISSEITGTLDETQRTQLYQPDLTVYLQTLQTGDDGSETLRIQRRLTNLKYSDHAIDGLYDRETTAAVKRFQKANGFSETGIADRTTQTALFSEAAAANANPLYEYQLRINTENQTVTAYQWQDGEYAKEARVMICSTGLDDTPTPAGTYKSTGPVARWCYFPSYGCWAQYAFRIKGGVLFHSVLYEQAKESTLIEGSVKKLGSKSSHGCVRLSVEDAKWIFENCAAGTTVIVE